MSFSKKQRRYDQAVSASVPFTRKQISRISEINAKQKAADLQICFPHTQGTGIIYKDGKYRAQVQEAVTKQQWLEHTRWCWASLTSRDIQGWNPEWGDMHREFDRFCTLRDGRFDDQDESLKDFFYEHSSMSEGKHFVKCGSGVYTRVHMKAVILPQDRDRYLTYSNCFDRLPSYAPVEEQAKNISNENLDMTIAVMIGIGAAAYLMFNYGEGFIDGTYGRFLHLLDFMHTPPVLLYGVIILSGVLTLAIVLGIFIVAPIFLGVSAVDVVHGRGLFSFWYKLKEKTGLGKNKHPFEFYKEKYFPGTNVLTAEIPYGMTLDTETLKLIPTEALYLELFAQEGEEAEVSQEYADIYIHKTKSVSEATSGKFESYYSPDDLKEEIQQEREKILQENLPSCDDTPIEIPMSKAEPPK